MSLRAGGERMWRDEKWCWWSQGRTRSNGWSWGRFVVVFMSSTYSYLVWNISFDERSRVISWVRMVACLPRNLMVLAAGDKLQLGAGQWGSLEPSSGKHLPMFSLLPQTLLPQHVDAVTFMWVLPVAVWFLGFNHHLQKIYSALQRGAEFLWWQVHQEDSDKALTAWALLWNWKRLHSACGILVVKHGPCILFQNRSTLFMKALGRKAVSQKAFQKRGSKLLKGRKLLGNLFWVWKGRGEDTIPRGSAAVQCPCSAYSASSYPLPNLQRRQVA